MGLRTIIVVASLLVGASAIANPTREQEAEADRAFQEGRELMKRSKFAQACTRFEDSNRLDPQNGTRYNLADCYEKLGRLGKALEIYDDLAEHDSYVPRRDKARDLAKALRPRVPWLQLDVTPPHPGHLEITLDGVDATPMVGQARPVQLGNHELSATADGYEAWHGHVEIRDEGSRTTTRVVLVPRAATSVTPPATSSPSPDHTYATWTLVGSGVLLVGAAAAGIEASLKWNNARQICGGSLCATPDDQSRANALADRATTYAHLADGLVVVGAAAAVVGVVLWMKAPADRDVMIVPSVGPSSASLVLDGHW